jgi:formylglycine-generating enzyme required for sulfatase activity
MSLRILSLTASLVSVSGLSAAITISTSFVGDAGNPNDTTGYGGVSYDYYIGTYEVTNSQYTAFLNAVDSSGTNPNGIWNSAMDSNVRGGIAFNDAAASGSKYSTRTNMADKPVNYVSFWDAARFTNWLTNGQGTGDTETGAYDLTNSTAITDNTVTRSSWFNATTGNTTTSTVWAITSENEWYKAAYYDPSESGPADNYWLYPTGSDTAPTVATANSTGDIANPGTNVANYSGGADWNSQNGNVTTVGSAGAMSASHYGTFDQGGNVFEWNDEILSTSRRGLRGGSYPLSDYLQSSEHLTKDPAGESINVGFRVSSLAPVPEPSTYAAIVGGMGLLIALMRRKRRV